MTKLERRDLVVSGAVQRHQLCRAALSQVGHGAHEKLGVVAEASKPLIAPHAKQPSDTFSARLLSRTTRMVVVDVQFVISAADGTQAILRLNHGSELLRRHFELPQARALRRRCALLVVTADPGAMAGHGVVHRRHALRTPWPDLDFHWATYRANGRSRHPVDIAQRVEPSHRQEKLDASGRSHLSAVARETQPVGVRKPRAASGSACNLIHVHSLPSGPRPRPVPAGAGVLYPRLRGRADSFLPEQWEKINEWVEKVKG